MTLIKTTSKNTINGVLVHTHVIVLTGIRLDRSPPSTDADSSSIMSSHIMGCTRLRAEDRMSALQFLEPFVCLCEDLTWQTRVKGTFYLLRANSTGIPTYEGEGTQRRMPQQRPIKWNTDSAHMESDKSGDFFRNYHTGLYRKYGMRREYKFKHQPPPPQVPIEGLLMNALVLTAASRVSLPGVAQEDARNLAAVARTARNENTHRYLCSDECLPSREVPSPPHPVLLSQRCTDCKSSYATACHRVGLPVGWRWRF